MPVLAALTGPLAKTGVIAVAALAALALLSRTPRTRASAYCGALVLAPLLLLTDIWSSPQLRQIHGHPLIAAIAAAIALAVLGALAFVLTRRPAMLGMLTVAALPFRVPIAAGGSTSNLLVPLYLVVAAGSLALVVPALAGRGRNEALTPPGWAQRLLALYVVVYGLQSVYSADFEKAVQQMVFFYVPFMLMFGLLTQLDWTPRLIRSCSMLVVGLAIVFAAIGFLEYSTKTILLNPKLVVANDLHAYFTVNSVFFDPDIFGRFLALVMVGLAGLLLYDGRMRRQLGAAVSLAVLWCGLVLTLSRSGLVALLVGLGTLAALRWRVSRAIAVAVVVLALGGAAIAVSPKTFGLNQGLNGASSGRASLVSGGIAMFADRPIWGYGSGSFVREYRLQHPSSSQTLAASHTIPITISAEQGMIGELVYLGLVIVAAVTLLRGARRHPARAALAAAFLALVFHTLLYADFLEDPAAWALLAVGCALAARGPAPREMPGGELAQPKAAAIPV